MLRYFDIFSSTLLLFFSCKVPNAKALVSSDTFSSKYRLNNYPVFSPFQPVDISSTKDIISSRFAFSKHYPLKIGDLATLYAKGTRKPVEYYPRELESAPEEKISKIDPLALLGKGIKLSMQELFMKVFDDSSRALDALLNHLDGGREYNSNLTALKGINKPVSSEIDVPLEMEIISGKIPEDIDGAFLRIGPNELRDDPRRGGMTYHLFDGHGFMNIFAVDGKNQKASYSRSWVKTPRFLIEKEKGYDIFHRLGTYFMPFFPFRLLSQAIKMKVFNLSALTNGAANTGVKLIKGRLYALNEGNLPFEIALKEIDNGYVMESFYFENFGNKLNHPMTSHPRIDPRNGNVIFASYNPVKSVFAVGEVSDNELIHLQEVSPRLQNSVGWAHDFALTDNYVVIPDGGMHFDMKSLPKGIFFETIGTLGFTIVPRNTSVTQREPFFVTGDRQEAIVHIATAWEEGDDIVIVTPVSGTLKGSPVNTDGLSADPVMYEFTKMTVSTKEGSSGKIKVERIHYPECNPEFPRVNPQMDGGRKVRYVFASCLAHPDDEKRKGDLNFVGIAKYDIEKMTVAGHIKLDEYWQIGEVIPIAKETKSQHVSDGSDAVWLIGVSVHVKTGESRVVVYDGESMSSEPVVVMRSPERVPVGFHGQFYQRASLKEEGRFERRKRNDKMQARNEKEHL